jgi:hypothetical protein
MLAQAPAVFANYSSFDLREIRLRLDIATI